MNDHPVRTEQPLPGGDPNVRRDVGGWISGPSLSEPLLGPVPPVPPGPTPLRELCGAVAQALTLPNQATTRDEVTYLRIMRDRARLVLSAMRRVLRDREIEDDPRDVMIVAASLRDEAASLVDDAYDHAPDPS
jgi:hypothetical protein